jgi:hypothetical protein
MSEEADGIFKKVREQRFDIYVTLLCTISSFTKEHQLLLQNGCPGDEASHLFCGGDMIAIPTSVE